MKGLPKCPPCWICGDHRSEWDHIHCRGAGGDDNIQNLQAVCRRHHQEKHRIGIKRFTKKYNLPIDIESIYPKRTDL